jgi:hypothetical protein
MRMGLRVLCATAGTGKEVACGGGCCDDVSSGEIVLHRRLRLCVAVEWEEGDGDGDAKRRGGDGEC